MPYLGVRPADITSATEAEIAGDLTVNTNNLKVDATTGRVGVGTASPQNLAHFKGTSSGENILHLDNSAGSGHGDTNNNVRVVSGNNGYWANLVIAGQQLEFKVQGGTSMLRVDSDGVKFNGDTAAANALDDYEEGTFTPTFSSGLTSPGYSTQVGTYVKVGAQVICSIMLRANSGTENSDHIRIGGLPFAFTSATDHAYGAFFTYNAGFWTSDANVTWLGLAGNTTLAFYQQDTGGSIAGTNSNVAANLNAACRLTAVYRTDS